MTELKIKDICFTAVIKFLSNLKIKESFRFYYSNDYSFKFKFMGETVKLKFSDKTSSREIYKKINSEMENLILKYNQILINEEEKEIYDL